jgi:hypothetical protein
LKKATLAWIAESAKSPVRDVKSLLENDLGRYRGSIGSMKLVFSSYPRSDMAVTLKAAIMSCRCGKGGLAEAGDVVGLKGVAYVVFVDDVVAVELRWVRSYLRWPRRASWEALVRGCGSKTYHVQAVPRRVTSDDVDFLVFI